MTVTLEIACPYCLSFALSNQGIRIICRSCNKQYEIENDIPKYYNLRKQSHEYKNIIGYSQVASEFTDDKRITSANFHQLSLQCFEKRISQLSKNDIALDLGCGIGFVTNILSKYLSVKNIIASDISVKMLKELQKKHPGIFLLCNSALKIPLGSSSVNAVFSSLCDPFCKYQMFKESYRILKPGGFLMITLPSDNWINGSREKKNISKFVLKDNSIIEVYSYLYSKAALLQLGTRAKFKENVVATRYGNDLNMGIISTSILKLAKYYNIHYKDLPLMDIYIFNK